jgi:hypothetical protein
MDSIRHRNRQIVKALGLPVQWLGKQDISTIHVNGKMVILIPSWGRNGTYLLHHQGYMLTPICLTFQTSSFQTDIAWTI